LPLGLLLRWSPVVGLPPPSVSAPGVLGSSSRSLSNTNTPGWKGPPGGVGSRSPYAGGGPRNGLAELLRKKGELKEAAEHYLNALSLAGGAEAQRAAGQKELAQLRASEGHDAAGFAAWLKGELDRRREERRAQALGSMLDRAVPKLPLTSLSGEPVDMSKLRGKVLLYKFFASW